MQHGGLKSDRAVSLECIVDRMRDDETVETWTAIAFLWTAGKPRGVLGGDEMEGGFVKAYSSMFAYEWRIW